MIARKSALVLANTLVGAVLGLVAYKAVAIWLDPAIVGRMATALGGLGILFFVTDLGFGAAHVKRVSEGVDEGDAFVTFAVFKVVATGVFLLAAMAFLYVRLTVLGKPFEDVAVSAYVFLVAYYAVQALRSAFMGTFEARRESARSQVAMLVDTVVRVLATIAVAAVFAAVAGATGPLAGVATADRAMFRWVAHYPSGALALTYFLGSGVSLAVAAWQWRRSGLRLGRFRPDILGSYWRFALPIFLLGVVGTFATHIDRLALGYFGSGADAGLFELPRRITLVLEAIPIAVAALLFPTVSEMHGRGDLAGARHTTERALRYLGMLLLPIAVFTALFAERVTSIVLSDKWQEASLALSLLVGTSFLLGMQRPYYALVIGLDKSAVAAQVGILMAVSNIVLNVLLIPDDIKSLGLDLPGLGVTGAALATFASGALGFAATWWAAQRHAGRVRAPGFWRQVASALVMGAALLAVHAYVHPLTRWYDLVLFTGFGGALYLGVLVALRGFTADDWRFLVAVVSPREMARYVKKEL